MNLTVQVNGKAEPIRFFLAEILHCMQELSSEGEEHARMELQSRINFMVLSETQMIKSLNNQKYAS